MFLFSHPLRKFALGYAFIRLKMKLNAAHNQI